MRLLTVQMEEGVTSPAAYCLTHRLANPQQMCPVRNHTAENHRHSLVHVESGDYWSLC